ncbi:hypothetical protein ABLE92_07120 [Gordonia sp. VNQ95]|uniref:hypothetical protein n=1 Tax=Gordonia TaxID=2053 RepID=UPI0032B365B7
MVAACAATCGLLLAACGSDTDTPASATPAVPSGPCVSAATAASMATQIPIPSASVTLTSPGTGPLRAASAAPDLASAQQVTLSTTSTESSTTAQTTQSLDTPLTVRFGCDAPDRLTAVLGAPTSAQPELGGQLPPVAGSVAEIGVGPGLAPLSLRLAPTDPSSESARRAVEQSLVQSLQNAITLPADPIGVGATWRTERTLSSAATVVQTVEARLTRWEGDRLTVSFTADESPVNSVFTIPGGDATLTIERYSYTGSGEVTIDLTRGLPVAGTAEYRGARELVGADVNQPLLQTFGFTMGWKSP